MLQCVGYRGMADSALWRPVYDLIESEIFRFPRSFTFEFMQKVGGQPKLGFNGKNQGCGRCRDKQGRSDSIDDRNSPSAADPFGGFVTHRSTTIRCISKVH
jgi:hypothetical protein